MAVQIHNFYHYVLTAIQGLIKGILKAIFWILVALGGYLIFQTKKTPIDLIIGLPLGLLGLGMAINRLWDSLLVIISPKYNRIFCRLCPEERFKNHKKLAEILK